MTRTPFARLRPADDVSLGSWLVDARAEYGTVDGLVPRGFEAYARILHPASSASGEPVRWSAIADWSGRSIHPTVQFDAITRPRPGAGRGDRPWAEPPREGWLSPEILEALSGVLAEHTKSAEECRFCLWEGYRLFDEPPSSAVAGFTPSTGTETALSARFPPAFVREVLDAPLVRVPQREYHLFEGPLTAAADMGYLLGGRFIPQSPNVFWPDDHAWCVASEIDLDSTYVGGSEALVSRLVDDRTLEVVRAKPDDSVWSDSDRVNR